jgi:hypothetical protein
MEGQLIMSSGSHHGAESAPLDSSIASSIDFSIDSSIASSIAFHHRFLNLMECCGALHDGGLAWLGTWRVAPSIGVISC